LRRYSSGRSHSRSHIGKYQTALTEPFFSALADAAGIGLDLRKCRGDNAHHITEAWPWPDTASPDYSRIVHLYTTTAAAAMRVAAVQDLTRRLQTVCS
jgi:hypothetical protein